MASITFTSDGGIYPSGSNYFAQNTPHYFRDPSTASWRGGIYWGTAGNEALCFVAANSGTTFRFFGGSDIASWTNSSWQGTPYLSIGSSSAFSGAVSASSFNATSSKTKKKNIEDCNLNASELLKNVKIVNYVLKDDEEEVPRVGFIAEDTDSLLSTPDHDHMDMGNCIGVLIKAMQEMSDKLKQSEEKIEKLELEIKELKKTSD